MEGSRETGRHQVVETRRFRAGDGRRQTAVHGLWNSHLRRSGSPCRSRVRPSTYRVCPVSADRFPCFTDTAVSLPWIKKIILRNFLQRTT